ncbi:MAG: dTDP-4-dehydrorhamnose reductase [Candidatus Omnitrophica bacterium]|nr:dTDP-4-dehydrorhamnose reductase [Candidatus Omnitrophota bacterium]
MKILVLGSRGQLGGEFQRYFTRTKTPFAAADRRDCDITRKENITAILGKTRPDVVINCTAYNLVDDAEDNPALAYAVNAQALDFLAHSCRELHIKLVHYSTDYVFNGDKTSPYCENDDACPLNVYGQSKLAGEKHVIEMADSLLLRVSWLIGSGRQNFLYKVKNWIEKSDTVRICDDEISVPTFASSVVELTDRALKMGLTGLYHVTNTGEASRYQLVVSYFDAMGIKGKTVVPVGGASFSLKAKRPKYSVMSNGRIAQALGVNVPDWNESLQKYVQGELRL